MGWIVYLLRCRGGSLYCGVTSDLTTRLHAHNTGRGAKYTRGRLPVTLVWSEAQPTHGAALRREAEVKKLRRAGKELLAAASPT